MDDQPILNFIYNIIELFELPSARSYECKYIIFEKEKFRHKGDVSIPRRKIYDEQDNIDSLLISESKNWKIPIEKVNVSKDFIHIFFKREAVFKEALSKVFNKQEMHGFLSNKSKKIIVHQDDYIRTALTQLRVNLASQFIKNITTLMGFQLLNESESKYEPDGVVQIFLTNRNSPPDGYHRVCVMGVEDKKKRCEMDIEQYKKLRLSEVTSLPTGISSEKTNLLVDACIKFEMLHGRLSSSARISVSNDGECSHITKDAIFLIYNYVRLKTILSTFQTKVDQGVYPNLPKVDQIDFSLLNKEEEWSILLDYIVRFPQMLSDFVSNLEEGNVQIHQFIIMLILFSNQLSRYYRRVRILTEPKDHLIQIMFARLHLLSACVNIYDILFDILNISTPPAM